MNRHVVKPPELERGFTLIELIVVIIILGIILSLAALNFSANTGGKVRQEADRLVLLLQTAHQEVILQSAIMVVEIAKDGYAFFGLDDQGKLQPLEQDDLFRTRTLADGVEIIHSEIEGAPTGDKSQIIFFPTGEITPFSITFARGNNTFTIRGTMGGDIGPVVEENTEIT